MKNKLTYKKKLEYIISNLDETEKSFFSQHPSMYDWKSYERKTIDKMFQEKFDSIKNNN